MLILQYTVCWEPTVQPVGPVLHVDLTGSAGTLGAYCAACGPCAPCWSYRVCWEPTVRRVGHVLHADVTGSSGSLLYGVWALCSMLIFMCFTCNLNAILFIPTYDIKLDTACQILERDLVKSLYFCAPFCQLGGILKKNSLFWGLWQEGCRRFQLIYRHKEVYKSCEFSHTLLEMFWRIFPYI